MFACKSCKVTKPAADFRVHKRGYRIGKCRPCERDYQREWSTRDRETYRRRKRESMARARAADPDAARAYGRAYHHANRETQLEKMRAYQTKRFFWSRAKKCLGATIHAKQLASLWKSQRGRCALTGRRLDRSAQIDHKIPRAKGGLDVIENLRWVCPEINYAKRDMSDRELLALCSDCMGWIGERIDMVERVSREIEVAA